MVSPATAGRPDRHGCVACDAAGSLRVAGPRLAVCESCGAVIPLAPRVSADSTPWPAEIPAHLAPGATLRDRYRLVDLLGRGPHGVTILAHHLYLDHACVVKILPYRIRSESDPAVQHLRTEASAGFRVNHPNVVRVFDCDVVDGHWYLVMEYVAGVDLATALAAGVRIPWHQAARFALDAARGLAAIHRAGLLHRDIKPSNLLLGDDGRVRVADLGVVGLMPGAAQSEERVAAVIGTLRYSAPEALQDPRASEPSSDLYSLGATLYELLVGTPPACPSIYQMLLRPNDRVPRWPASADDVPSWLSETVLRLLQPIPQQRTPSAEELVATLESQSSSSPTPPSRGPERPPARGLAILPLQNLGPQTTDSWLGQVIADHLGQHLAQRPDVHLVDRDQFETLLKRVEQRARRTRMARLLEAARLSGAATVVEGTFRRTGSEIEIAVTVHEAGVRSPIPVASVRGPIAALSDLEGVLSQRLAQAVGLAAGPAGGARHRAPLEAERRFVDARTSYLHGDYATAVRLAKEAVELDPEYGEAIGFVGVCCARMGDYDEATVHHERQLALATERQDTRLQIEAHANRGTMHYFRGEYEAAADSLAAAVRIAEQAGQAADVALIRNNLGFALQQLGRAEEAEEHFQRAIETHRKTGALTSLIGPYNGMGHIRSGAARFDEARSYFQRALALAQESDDFVNVGVAYMNLGNCALQAGDLAAAKQELVTALNVLERTSFWNGLARVYEYMAELNLRQESWIEAARCAGRRLDLAQRHKNRRIEEAARRQLVAALRGAGREADAQAALGEGSAPALQEGIACTGR